MEFDNNTPIYLQVINKIKQDIVCGKLKAGDKLPSSRDLAIELNINFNTVARVYKELEIEGIVFTKRGLGTFVTESKVIIENIRYEMADKLIRVFTKGMFELGFTVEEIIRFIKENGIKSEISNAEKVQQIK